MIFTSFLLRLGLCCSLVLVPALLSVSIASAHPGRTDSSGGHTCRTNCSSWGLSTDEYHYHGGSGDSSASESNTTTTPPARPRVVGKAIPGTSLTALSPSGRPTAYEWQLCKRPAGQRCRSKKTIGRTNSVRVTAAMAGYTLRVRAKVNGTWTTSRWTKKVRQT